MAFTDPLVVSIGGANKNLTRWNSDKGFSEYRLAETGQTISALIKSTEGKTDSYGQREVRHLMSIRQVIHATSTEPEKVRQAQITVTHVAGDDVTAWDDLAIAVATMATAGNMSKLNNFES